MVFYSLLKRVLAAKQEFLSTLRSYQTWKWDLPLHLGICACEGCQGGGLTWSSWPPGRPWPPRFPSHASPAWPPSPSCPSRLSAAGPEGPLSPLAGPGRVH
eukprot:scaffold647897_cov39-Prasinocladus_malaysianus.AAC.2